MHEAAIDALVEEEKFISFFYPDGWPQEMATIRKHLLGTTILDVQVSENGGNTSKILSSLLSAYQRHVPAVVAPKETK